MIYFQIADGIELPVEIADLERAAVEALRRISAHADLTVVLTDDEQLRQLNFQFLGIDAPTDVLSFPAGDTDQDTNAFYLGDILISVPRAQVQAIEGGHSIQEELQLLVVHGVLHLLGYDHAEQADKAAMWLVQAKILNRLGCRAGPPP